MPAAMRPRTGMSARRRQARAIAASSSTIMIALGLVGSRLIAPALTSADRCECTVDGEERPTASPISRTEGGIAPLRHRLTYVFEHLLLTFREHRDSFGRSRPTPIRPI